MNKPTYRPKYEDVKKSHQNHTMWGRKIYILYRFIFILMRCLSIYDYQAKASRYRKGLMCLKNRATTNQNQTSHSQKLKRKVLKHKINGKHPIKKKKKKERKKKRRKEKHRINWKTRFKMAINTYLSIITLNVNGLNAPIKRHRVAFWIKKQKP